MYPLVIAVMLVAQIDISGYVETRPYIAWGDSTNAFGSNRGWIEFKTDEQNYGGQVAFDLSLPYDTTSLSYAESNIGISRLALWLGPENLRLVAGKQRLYWGVARVFKPLDIFNPVNYYEPGYEKPGSNALLGYAALGSLTSIRAIIVPRFRIRESIGGVRFGSHLIRNDIGLNIIHQRSPEKTIAGFELAGELSVGYWGEFSYEWEDSTQYAKVSVGVDYTFPFLLYAMVEYFFDESGESDWHDYDISEISDGTRMTLAQQYLYLSLGLAYNPFFRPVVNAIVNADDGGVILIPQVSYAIFDNAELVSGLNFFLGPETSEFRSIVPYDGQGYIWAKVYF
jgi:hypothetical protein